MMDTINIVIRNMKESDLDSILEIENKAFNPPWSREAFSLELSNNLLAKYIVAEVDDHIVGYGGIWLIIDEGHVTNIAVDEEYRNKGIGSRIIEGLIQVCKDRNMTAITLEVRQSNETAKNLYKKYGFIEYGTRKGYYQNNHEDAIIMWKDIEY